MKIAILSDAHGNQFYFEQCLKQVDQQAIQEIYYLGDCFGYLSEGNFILEQLLARKATCLLGNHEAMLLGLIEFSEEKDKVYRIMEARKKLSVKEKNYLSSLKPFHEQVIEKQRILFVHGNLLDPLRGYLYEDSDSLFWHENEYDVIFMGHTHYPFEKRIGHTHYINAGSCGLPRDIGNMPSYAIYDTITKKAEICRILIDSDSVKEKYKNCGNQNVYNCLLRNNRKA